MSVIFLFNVLAALFFPTLGAALGLSNDGFALFAGTAINDTSSVTAAASTWDTLHGTGGAVLESATIVKLTRTLAIIPITLALAFWRTRQAKKNGGVQGGSFSLKKIFSLLYPVFCAGLSHYHSQHPGRDQPLLLLPAQRAVQVLHYYGHGRHRPEHRRGKTGQERRQASFLGLCCWVALLKRQPSHAAYAGPVLTPRLFPRVFPLKGHTSRWRRTRSFSPDKKQRIVRLWVLIFLSGYAMLSPRKISYRRGVVQW